jgi:thiol-disulfide isomerase/thioredoxin
MGCGTSATGNVTPNGSSKSKVMGTADSTTNDVKPASATLLTQNSAANDIKASSTKSLVTQSNWAVDLLGATLCSRLGQVETNDALANKKLICLYFSAHWCPPCRGFTPVLEEKYKELKGTAPDDMEVIFVSSDRDSDSFDEYYASMSWLAIPFADRAAKQRISEKFGVSGIPMLVVLDGATGAIKVANGRSDMHNGKVEEVVKRWCDAPAIAQSMSEKKPAPPQSYAASDYLWVPASGIPKTLTVTKTGDFPAGQKYVENYVGVWRHEPLPTNPHIFTHTSSGETMYWQDNRFHWRTGGRQYADPSMGGFGCGQAYLRVPGGPSERYSQYATVVNGNPGLTFSWAW